MVDSQGKINPGFFPLLVIQKKLKAQNNNKSGQEVKPHQSILMLPIGQSLGNSGGNGNRSHADVLKMNPIRLMLCPMENKQDPGYEHNAVENISPSRTGQMAGPS